MLLSGTGGKVSTSFLAPLIHFFLKGIWLFGWVSFVLIIGRIWDILKRKMCEVFKDGR